MLRSSPACGQAVQHWHLARQAVQRRRITSPSLAGCSALIFGMQSQLALSKQQRSAKSPAIPPSFQNASSRCRHRWHRLHIVDEGLVFIVWVYTNHPHATHCHIIVLLQVIMHPVVTTGVVSKYGGWSFGTVCKWDRLGWYHRGTTFWSTTFLLRTKSDSPTLGIPPISSS